MIPNLVDRENVGQLNITIRIRTWQFVERAQMYASELPKPTRKKPIAFNNT